jgi:signal peptidase I
MGTSEGSPGAPSWARTVVIGRNPKRTLVRILVLVGVSFILMKFVLAPIRIEGISMLPTLREAGPGLFSRVRGMKFINRLAYRTHEPRRGDIVAIRLAGEHVMFLKRIVGLPGETVAWHDGKLLINGEVLEEPYLKLPCQWEREPETDGPDEYFVVGDNRSMGEPEHTKGRATRSRIVGKML